MYKKGSVSLWFLSIFIMICMLSGIVSHNVRCRIDTVRNIEKTNEYLAAEEAVISLIRCRLKNKESVSGLYTEAGISFQAQCSESGCTVFITDPVRETLEVQLTQDAGNVYDYAPAGRST